MRRAILALLLVALAGSARADEWSPPNTPAVALQVAAEVLIAVDVMQTVDMNRRPAEHFYEVNPLLGPHPSNARIITMASCAGIATAGAWYALPPRIRWVVPAVVIAMESLAIAGNVQAGLTLRF